MNKNFDSNSLDGSLISICSTESSEEPVDSKHSESQTRVGVTECTNEDNNIALKKAWDIIIDGFLGNKRPPHSPGISNDLLDFFEKTHVSIENAQIFPQFEFAAYYAAMRVALGFFREKKISMQDAWDDWLEYNDAIQTNPFILKIDLLSIGEKLLKENNKSINSCMEQFEKIAKHGDWFTLRYSEQVKSIMPEMEKLWAWSREDGNNNPLRIRAVESGIIIGMIKMDFDLMIEALSLRGKMPYNIGLIDDSLDIVRQWIKTHEMGGKIILKSFAPFNLDDQRNLMRYRYRPIIEPSMPAWPISPLDMVFKTLDQEFPWMHRATRLLHLSMRISMSSVHQIFKFRPVLLVGPPASGKSHFARRITELLGIPSLGLSGSGMTDDKVLMGVPRGWNSARPSVLADLLVKNSALNPLVIFDELDKVTESPMNGSAWNALLTMLEPGDAKQFYDPYFMGEMDISNFSWLLLANSTRNLPEPLLTRLSVVNVDRPSGNQIIDVGWSMWRVIGKESGLPWQQWPEITDNDMLGIVKNFGDSNLRRLRRALEVAFYRSLEEKQQDRILQ